MDINDLTQRMHTFVREKGWYGADSQRPQTPKNLAISLTIEAGEVLEHFQWRENTPDPNELAGELADVFLYLLQLASVLDIDLENAVLEKIRVNADRHWDEQIDEQKENHEN